MGVRLAGSRVPRRQLDIRPGLLGARRRRAARGGGVHLRHARRRRRDDDRRSTAPFPSGIEMSGAYPSIPAVAAQRRRGTWRLLIARRSSWLPLGVLGLIVFVSLAAPFI